MNQVLVIGTGGQVSRAYQSLLPEAVFLGRGALDLAFPERVREVLERYTPSAVINTAAYTQVDKAETEEEIATRVNADAPKAMAEYCAARHIPFVHFSTDYVFDGSGDNARREDAPTAPLNAYGRSKQAGEQAVIACGGKYLIFRTSWVYDAPGKNFVNTILRLAAEREELRVINDQFGAPTYAPHLAMAALAALSQAEGMQTFPSGIYHLCNQGVTTWFHFAEAIVAQARRLGLPLKVSDLHPIAATEYPLPAPRPYNSRLDCGRVHTIFGLAMPSWEEGLEACMEEKCK